MAPENYRNIEDLTHRGEGRWRSEDPDGDLSSLVRDGLNRPIVPKREIIQKCSGCGYYHNSSHFCPDLGEK